MAEIATPKIPKRIDVTISPERIGIVMNVGQSGRGALVVLLGGNADDEDDGEGASDVALEKPPRSFGSSASSCSSTLPSVLCFLPCPSLSTFSLTWRAFLDLMSSSSTCYKHIEMINIQHFPRFGGTKITKRI